MDAELFPADRRTGMTKLKVSFRNFLNAPKKWMSFMAIPVNYGSSTEEKSAPATVILER